MISVDRFKTVFKSGGGGPLFETQIVTLDGNPVIANGGTILTPSRSVHEAERSDLILLPAFFPPPDKQNKRIKAICQWVRESYQYGIEVACTCTGTFLLAETGLLNGKTATTNWLFADSFKREYPKVNLQIERILTEDQGLYCTGAATSFMSLCLHFIEKYGSVDLASHCAKALLVDTDRHIQSPYAIHDFRKNHADNQILKAQQWMEKKYESKFSMEEVAATIGISSRHFKRRFKTATGARPLPIFSTCALKTPNVFWSAPRTPSTKSPGKSDMKISIHSGACLSNTPACPPNTTGTSFQGRMKNGANTGGARHEYSSGWRKFQCKGMAVFTLRRS